jgi:hypothetical protein
MSCLLEYRTMEKSPEKFCQFCTTYTIVRILSSLPELNLFWMRPSVFLTCKRDEPWGNFLKSRVTMNFTAWTLQHWVSQLRILRLNYKFWIEICHKSTSSTCNIIACGSLRVHIDTIAIHHMYLGQTVENIDTSQRLAHSDLHLLAS